MRQTTVSEMGRRRADLRTAFTHGVEGFCVPPRASRVRVETADVGGAVGREAGGVEQGRRGRVHFRHDACEGGVRGIDEGHILMTTTTVEEAAQKDGKVEKERGG